MNELALFAGAGGGLLGSKLLGWRTVCYVENDPYCVQVIQQRIRDGMLDDAPIWDEVRTFDGYSWAGRVDIVTGGFPCQPWSVAGKHAGELDERNLWPDTIRIIREVKPQWCLLENVPGILSRSYIRRIFADLAESGYCVRWDCIPAALVGAPHIRKRLWIVANACSERRQQNSGSTLGDEEQDERWTEEDNHQLTGNGKGSGERNVSNTDINQYQVDSFENEWQATEVLFTDAESIGRNGGTGLQETATSGWGLHAQGNNTWWAAEPKLGRVANGVANRVDRLRAIGNGQVPAVVRAAWGLMTDETL